VHASVLERELSRAAVRAWRECRRLKPCHLAAFEVRGRSSPPRASSLQTETLRPLFARSCAGPDNGALSRG
jgi:hypothetical protein